ncbi:hypothetical protein C5167_014368 [Papaver somniferum]|uniref:Uncharacterized protein n=1 Tax=Papaver somniferum TaxID=3469 RepID=A0A4Y7J2Y7_PAPSO|nr:hypothetical protein C5167_014368 [Papaver somniferum]
MKEFKEMQWRMEATESEKMKNEIEEVKLLLISEMESGFDLMLNFKGLRLSQIEKTGFLLQLVVELRYRSCAVEIQGLDGVAGGDLMGERKWWISELMVLEMQVFGGATEGTGATGWIGGSSAVMRATEGYVVDVGVHLVVCRLMCCDFGDVAEGKEVMQLNECAGLN